MDDDPGTTGLPVRAREDEHFALEDGIGFRLSRLTRSLRAEWAGELAALGLTPPQAAVLRAIGARPGLSLRALARTLGTEPMRAKRCVDDLETAGLLRSAHRGEDRRPRELSLGPKGQELAGRVDMLVRRQEGRIDKVLGDNLRPGLDEALGALEGLLGIGTLASTSGAHSAGGSHTSAGAAGARDEEPAGRPSRGPSRRAAI